MLQAPNFSQSPIYENLVRDTLFEWPGIHAILAGAMR